MMFLFALALAQPVSWKTNDTPVRFLVENTFELDAQTLGLRLMDASPHVLHQIEAQMSLDCTRLADKDGLTLDCLMDNAWIQSDSHSNTLQVMATHASRALNSDASIQVKLDGSGRVLDVDLRNVGTGRHVRLARVVAEQAAAGFDLSLTEMENLQWHLTDSKFLPRQGAVAPLGQVRLVQRGWMSDQGLHTETQGDLSWGTLSKDVSKLEWTRGTLRSKGIFQPELGLLTLRDWSVIDDDNRRFHATGSIRFVP